MMESFGHLSDAVRGSSQGGLAERQDPDPLFEEEGEEFEAALPKGEPRKKSIGQSGDQFKSVNLASARDLNLGERMEQVAKKGLNLWVEIPKFIALAMITVPITIVVITPLMLATSLVFLACWGVTSLLNLSHRDESLQRYSDLFQSLVIESLAIIFLGLAYSVNMEWFEPDEPVVDGGCHLFVHGIAARSSHWLMLKFFRGNKHNDYFINLGHPFQSIHTDYIETLHEKVLTICEKTGQLPTFTCHSMGGRVTLEWWLWVHENQERLDALQRALGKNPLPERIQIRALGTPFAGTEAPLAHVAAFLGSKAAGEMLSTNSTFEKYQEKYSLINGAKVDLWHYATPNDTLVPVESAEAQLFNGRFIIRELGVSKGHVINHAAMPMCWPVYQALEGLEIINDIDF